MSMIRNLVLAAALGLGFSAWAGEPVDINSASAKELATAIKGVGDEKAAAIVEYRNAHGPFKSVDELTNVKGIGAKTIDENRSRITVKAGSMGDGKSKP